MNPTNALPNGTPMSNEDLGAMLSQLTDLKQFTMWHNPTQHDVPLELHQETPKPTPGISIAQRVANAFPNLPAEERDHTKRGTKAWQEFTGKRFFLVKAGASMLIPSEYDRAIQDVKEGVIMGGLGTTLQRMGTESRPILHPALDALAATNKKLAEDARKAREDMAVLQDKLTISQRDHAVLASAEVSTTIAAKDREIAELRAKLEGNHVQAAKTADVQPDKSKNR